MTRKFLKSDVNRRLSGREGVSQLVLAGLLLVVAVLQLLPFLTGYRQTADDVFLFKVYLDGWGAVWQFAVDAAIQQGRVGQFIMTPLNTFGASFSSDPVMRFVFVALHFGVLGLFAYYVRTVLRRPIGVLVFLFLLSWQPLGYIYLPPTAYPLQNTLPIMFVLLVRLALTSAVDPLHNRFGMRDFGLYALMAAAMAVTEFALIFATALLALEYLYRLIVSWRGSGSVATALRTTLGNPHFFADCGAIVLVLVAYVAFRLVFPSQYSGNSADGLQNVRAFGETLVRHVWGGTIFAHLDNVRFAGASVVDGARSATVGILSGAVAWLIWPRASSLRIPVSIVLVSLVLAAYVTAPLAANVKQQVWCMSSENCAYLDSRISYLWVALATASLAVLLLRAAPPGLPQHALRIFLSLGLGYSAALTSGQNEAGARDMRHHAETWERAAVLACNLDVIPQDDSVRLRIIDPGLRVSVHPSFEPMALWNSYMAHVAQSGRCASPRLGGLAAIDAIQTYLPDLAVGGSVVLSMTSGGALLGQGWSRPEDWGVWSVGTTATLDFFVRDWDRNADLVLTLRFNPYFGPSVDWQTVVARVRGRDVGRLAVNEADAGEDCCWLDLPLSPRDIANDGRVTVTLDIANRRDPEEDESPDPRRLGIGLQRLSLSAS